MARLLAYTSPSPGHLFPAVGLLLELRARGHEVHLRASGSEVERLSGLGLDAAPVDPAIEAIERGDWRVRSQIRAQVRSVQFYAARAELEVADLRRAVQAVAPDALVVDVQTEGAGYAAEASGLAWASYCPYPPAFRSADAPPISLGLSPARGPAGRLRDRMLRMAGDRLLAPHVAVRNSLRASLGLRPLGRYEDQWKKPDRFLALTAEPYEFHRTDWPAHVRLVGPIAWDPPAPAPSWLERETRPIVLVTASTAYQQDETVISTALRAFAAEDVAVVATTAAHRPGTFSPPPNARVERFVPHRPLIERAACVVCHGGQGITQKALAAGVPVCVVPFRRDQFDVARRVVNAGAGTKLHHRWLRPARLRRAVRRAMARREGAARVAHAFAQTGGATAAADAVEELLEPAPVSSG